MVTSERIQAPIYEAFTKRKKNNIFNFYFCFIKIRISLSMSNNINTKYRLKLLDIDESF